MGDTGEGVLGDGNDGVYEARERAVWEMSTYRNNIQICQTVL